MKVLFLDIDGVLNSHRWYKTRGKEPWYRTYLKDKDFRKDKEGRDWVHELDPDCVDRLIKIIGATNCNIVISSTWRKLHTNFEIAYYLTIATIAHSYTPFSWIKAIIIGKTPILDKVSNGGILISSTRGDEIKKWLDNENHEEPIEKYVIVDDDSDMLPEQKPFFVKINYDVGLTDEDVERIIGILNG